jgi:hypothetical protein
MVYSRHGEAYGVAGHTLRYVSGTRPVWLRYVESANSNVRYDALQVQLFSKGLREGNFAIDVGAHAGQYAILMAAMSGQTGRVVAKKGRL